MIAPRAAVVLSLLSLVAAQSPATINTPTSIVECEPTALTFAGSSPPFIISTLTFDPSRATQSTVLPGGQVSAAALETLPTQDASGTYTWTADIAADATGQINYAQQVTIQEGSTSCLSSSAASGASTSAAATSGASTTPDAVTTTSAAANTTSAAGNSTANATVISTTSSSSSSSSTTAVTSTTITSRASSQSSSTATGTTSAPTSTTSTGAASVLTAQGSLLALAAGVVLAIAA
ncbi:hypothetical protein MNV49_002363 [Pseudohyphozyma bogoriensis]|nr:hypothetical protein MNV49_002363 [Pseudohyphozyma bogoriensis]